MNLTQLIKIIAFYGRLTPSYTQIGFYARRLSWHSKKPFNFDGQCWLITGANAGLGKAMMHAAVSSGADVIAVARNAEKLDAAIAELPTQRADRVTPLIADMSLQIDTQKLLDSLIATDKSIDVLQNNVGVLLNEHTVTSEGREKSFVTNILSHFLLTEGLLEQGKFAKSAVIVNMSSGGMYNVPLTYKLLNNLDPAKYNGKVAYGFAKRAQLALSQYWNEQYCENGLRVYTTHPGWARTPGVKSSLPLFWKLQNLILRTPAQGADTALWLCAERPEVSRDEEVIWFDRKPRPTHLFAHTRTPRCTVAELVDFLKKELLLVSGSHE